jgi:DNA polymerase iota
VTDLVDYNINFLNINTLDTSFFHLSKSDPTQGFQYDATKVAGQAYRVNSTENPNSVQHDEDSSLRQRLILGSHLILYIRTQMEDAKGYTCTGGVGTNKLVSKLVGNVHKPRDQTTMMPPYIIRGDQPSNVTSFIDEHEVGKIPGIGFKMAIKLREHAYQRKVEVKDLIFTIDDNDLISVGDFKKLPGLDEAVLERILGGSGAPKGIGSVVWKALHGLDEREVAGARDIPKQISIEDSYLRLDTLEDAIKQMIKLSQSLIARMRLDLTGVVEEEQSEDHDTSSDRVWLAQPKTIRLSTRPRAPVGPDSTRARTFQRISRSRQLPSFMMNMTEPVTALAEKVTAECLLPMFRQIHPQRDGWNLSLINVAVTDIQEMAGERKMAVGRDISKMFKNQDAVLSAFRVYESNEPQPPAIGERPTDVKAPNMASMSVVVTGSEDLVPWSQQSRFSEQERDWEDDESMDASYQCHICGAIMPDFAITAHDRFHQVED